MLPATIVIIVLTVIVLISVAVIRFRARRQHYINMAHARSLFHQRREWLEARFLTEAAASGRPRGLRWCDCDFANGVSFARDRTTGELRALVGVTVRFEAVVGGPMEDIQAVRNLRAATAVFRYDGQQWVTDGRAIFNLSPDETIRHFQHELEAVVLDLQTPRALANE
jgi:hypothetical protein